MLLWLGFKAFQHLESGLARGGQKCSISFDTLQNMMIRGVGPETSEHYPTQLPLKASFLLLITMCCPPSVLYRVGAEGHGFKFGSAVGWLSQESYVTHVPQGTVGIVTGVKDDKIIINFGMRQLLLHTADLCTI